MDTSYIKKIEDLVDQEFDRNEVLDMPFCKVYSFMCELLTFNLVENKTLDHSLLNPYYYILAKLKNFQPLSLQECFDSAREMERSDWLALHHCAILNIVFPQIHRGLYEIKPDGDNSSLIQYSSETAAALECRDVVLTNLSLPVIVSKRKPSDDFIPSIRKYLEKKGRLEPWRFESEIRRNYSDNGLHHEEAEFVPSHVYLKLGFSNERVFGLIRRALMALGEVYISSAIIARVVLGDGAEFDGHRVGLAMERMKVQDLIELVKKICGACDADIENFLTFFQGCAKNNKMSNSFMPPFWLLGDYYYFMPGLLPTVLGQRNLLIGIQNDSEKKKRYNFDGEISQHFEPTLIARAKNLFERGGLEAKSELTFDKYSVDLAVFCKRSNCLLTIQAKATLTPENARMVDRLDGRVREAVQQIQVLDEHGEEAQSKIFGKWFPGNSISGQGHLRAVLVNSSFGSFKSWQLMEDVGVLPLNPYILSRLDFKAITLAELPAAVWAIIDEVERSSEPVLTEKNFAVGSHQIKQQHYELSGLARLQKDKAIGSLRTVLGVL